MFNPQNMQEYVWVATGIIEFPIRMHAPEVIKHKPGKSPLAERLSALAAADVGDGWHDR